MTLTDSDLSELLVALKAGEVTDTIRASLEWILQQLIEVEATASSAPVRTSGPTPGPRSATGIARGCCRPQLAMSSWRSQAARRFVLPVADRSGDAGSTGRCSRW